MILNLDLYLNSNRCFTLQKQKVIKVSKSIGNHKNVWLNPICNTMEGELWKWTNYWNGKLPNQLHDFKSLLLCLKQDGNPDGLFWTMESCLTSNLMKKSNKVAKAP